MKPESVTIRRGTSRDVTFLSQMLYEAAFWRPDRPRSSMNEGLADPHLSRYITRWGRSGDTAVVPLDDRGQPIGAAWYRLFTDEPGYGFIDSSTPEVSMAVVEEHRGLGIGRALLNSLIPTATSEGFTALSLSVEQDNPAVALFESVGFMSARLENNAWTMWLNLTAEQSDSKTNHVTE
ncbi:MAG: GNAT family N-acetyltransferase [Actinomycetota bacterium]